MIEVFKTNVTEEEFAYKLLEQIHSSYQNYSANFDLEDCDKILRVESMNGYVQSVEVINLLENLGCQAELLSDL